MKKIFSLILSLILSCLFVINCFAFSINSDSYSFSELDNRVSSLTNLIDKDTRISNRAPLYDSNEKIIAWCYTLSPKGYVIINSENYIIEYSLYNNLNFGLNEKIYYTGPLQYFKKDGNSYTNLKSLKKVEKKYFNDLSARFDKKKEQIKSTEQSISRNNITPNSLVTTNIPGTLRTYSYNPNGICGSTAAAILLMYYRDYIDSFVVPSWHATQDGKSLIQLLEPNIDGATPGSVTTDVVSGLNWYFRWRGISNSYNARSTVSTSFNAYRQRIDAKRPAIVGIHDHPTYSAHWTVGHGYRIEQHGSTYYYAMVNDGWGSNNIEISMRYVDDIVYLNK